MSKYIKLFKQSINIGGSFLPADFPYFTEAFISKLCESDFCERITLVYEAVSNRKLSQQAFKNLENAQYPASVVSVDDGLNLIELFDGSNAEYGDYIFDKSDLLGEVSSFIAVLFSAYCDLIESEQLNLGNKFNVALTQSDSTLLLSAFIAKKIGLPISVITIATTKPIKDAIKGCYFYSFSESEIDEVIGDFFDEYDYPLDVVSAESFIPLVSYLSDCDDENLFLMPALVSPYKFTRRVLKAVTGKNEIDVLKAERLLYSETAMEIPSVISSNNNAKFFAKRKSIPLQDVIQIIKQCI
ncbi:MAG: hypothetical protein IKV61_01205 [Clostridia bacterium]|nr:hypothetical protein [Clostridia bacterium]